MDLLKQLQPATRLLQAHAAAVTAKRLLGALKQVAPVKKELEAILFKVKAMLAVHGCPGGFWMGNLKHKNVAGEEVSSQMAIPVKEKKAGKRKRAEEDDAAAVEEEDAAGMDETEEY